MYIAERNKERILDCPATQVSQWIIRAARYGEVLSEEPARNVDGVLNKHVPLVHLLLSFHLTDIPDED